MIKKSLKRKFQKVQKRKKKLKNRQGKRSLIVKEYDSKRKYAKEHLGVMTVVSGQTLFGGKRNIEDLIKKIQEHKDVKDLLIKISCLANHVSHSGLNSLGKDRVQYELLKKYIIINNLDKKVKHIDLETHSLITPHGINGVLMFLLRYGNVLTDFDKDEFYHTESLNLVIDSFITLNDYVFGDIAEFDPSQNDGLLNFCIDGIKNDFFNTSQTSTMSVFISRSVRFNLILNYFVNELKKDNTFEKINDYFESFLGVTLEEFIFLSFVMNACWMSKNEEERLKVPPAISISYSSLKNMDRLNILLDKFSSEYESGFEKIKQANVKDFNNVRNIISLISKPFLKRTQEDHYMVLAPHLLNKCIEESLFNAFFSEKSNDVNVRVFYGPYGRAFEKYINELLVNISKKDNYLDYFVEFPMRNDGKELCDAIAIRGHDCFIIEIKSKRPNLEMFNRNSEENVKFKNWLSDVFVKEAAGKGKSVFEQFENSKKYIIENGYKGYKPKRYFSVSVISSEFVAPAFLHLGLKELVKLESNKEVLKCGNFVVLSVNDLELGVNNIFPQEDSFWKMIHRKCLDDEILKISVPNYFYQNGFSKINIKSKLVEHFDELFKRCVDYIKE